jgi:hypothetical protein
VYLVLLMYSGLLPFVPLKETHLEVFLPSIYLRYMYYHGTLQLPHVSNSDFFNLTTFKAAESMALNNFTEWSVSFVNSNKNEVYFPNIYPRSQLITFISILSVHDMFRPLWAIFRWNITSFIYLW